MQKAGSLSAFRLEVFREVEEKDQPVITAWCCLSKGFLYNTLKISNCFSKSVALCFLQQKATVPEVMKACGALCCVSITFCTLTSALTWEMLLKMRQGSSYHAACTDFIVKMCERFSLGVVSSPKT